MSEDDETIRRRSNEVSEALHLFLEAQFPTGDVNVRIPLNALGTTLAAYLMQIEDRTVRGNLAIRLANQILARTNTPAHVVLP